MLEYYCALLEFWYAYRKPPQNPRTAVTLMPILSCLGVVPVGSRSSGRCESGVGRGGRGERTPSSVCSWEASGGQCPVTVVFKTKVADDAGSMWVAVDERKRCLQDFVWHCRGKRCDRHALRLQSQWLQLTLFIDRQHKWQARRSARRLALLFSPIRRHECH